MNVPLAQLYGALILAGVVLITLEVFIPGGVVGAIGALALLAAAVVAINAFPGVVGVLASIGAVVFTVFAVVLWMKLFPRTRMGRALTVATDLSAAHSETEGLVSLLGASGQSVSALRPAGFAVFGERRVDVVTRGEALPPDTAVRVVQVEGNRVVVEAISCSEKSS